MKTGKYSAVLFAAMMAVGSVQAADLRWDGGGVGNDWSNPTNWNAAANDDVPDNNTDTAGYFGSSSVDINVDQDVTVKKYTDGFSGAGQTNTIGGPGTLTIDGNQNNQTAIANSTGNAGGTLKFTGKVAINNSLGGATYVNNNNSSGNTTLFDTGSTLTLSTSLLTASGFNAVGSSIQFNGTFGASSANLIIASDNVSFGAGHDSSGFGREIVFYNGAKLAIDGGTVLASNRKVQVNGDGELELNGANAINGANMSVADENNLLLDVNSDQNNMGWISFGTGTVTIDVAAGVADLFFADSSARTWGGSVVINGFQEGVIKFGSDASGLNAGQLAAFDGTYGLTETGYLTVIPEPGSIALFAIGGLGLYAQRRRRF